MKFHCGVQPLSVKDVSYGSLKSYPSSQFKTTEDDSQGGGCCQHSDDRYMSSSLTTFKLAELK